MAEPAVHRDPAALPAVIAARWPPPAGKRAFRVEGTAAELLLRLDASAGGLSSEQAETRARERGPGARAPGRIIRAYRVIRGVVNPLVAVLVVAGVASAFLGEVVEAALIGAMVVLSAAIDSWQTTRSARAVQRLPGADHADGDGAARRRVARAAARASSSPATSSGSRPATSCPPTRACSRRSDLHVQQAALTGESLPVEKAATEPRRRDRSGRRRPRLPRHVGRERHGDGARVRDRRRRPRSATSPRASRRARPRPSSSAAPRQFGLLITADRHVPRAVRARRRTSRCSRNALRVAAVRRRARGRA